jgi:hypothetical protein
VGELLGILFAFPQMATKKSKRTYRLTMNSSHLQIKPTHLDVQELQDALDERSLVKSSF